MTSSIEAHENAHVASTRSVVPTVTTLNLLVLAAVVLTSSLIVLTLVAGGVVTKHRRVADAIVDQSTPLVLGAQDLYISLAAADAMASTAFLQAGRESPELRQQYRQHLAEAGLSLALIAGELDPPPSVQPAIETIARELPRYAGLVETARTNSRLQFPVGAAYLRDASDLMRVTLLPAATSAYEEAARDLDDEYRSGASRTPLVVLLATAVGVIAVLIATQLLVTQRTRRLLNPGLIGATALVVVVAVTSLVLLASQHDSLANSRTKGADPLLVTSTSRILVLRSLSDENLDLIERGTEPLHMDDFAAIVDSLGGSAGDSGLIADVVESDKPAIGTNQAIELAYADYLAIHDDVRELSDAGSFDEAIDVAVSGQAAAAARLDAALDDNVTAARIHLDREAEVARSTLERLLPVVLVLPGLAAVFAIAGIRRRIREYR